MALFFRPTREKKSTYTIKYRGSSLYPSTSFKVVLLGDSLINLPYQDFHLAQLIQSYFPNTALELINAGVNGNTIKDIQKRLKTDVLDQNPDAVILFWDSDLSKNEVDTLELPETQQDYSKTLREVIAAIMAKTPYIAICSPGLLGEPGSLFNVKRYDGKDPVLDLYRDINRMISAECGVDFIDMRSALFNAIPALWPFQRWCVTTDGEHPNEKGTKVEAAQFAPVINKWLNYLASNPQLSPPSAISSIPQSQGKSEGPEEVEYLK